MEGSVGVVKADAAAKRPNVTAVISFMIRYCFFCYDINGDLSLIAYTVQRTDTSAIRIPV